MVRMSVVYCFFTVLLLGVNIAASGQETDRAPFAVEFPELSTGKISDVKSYITRSDLSQIKFWISGPVAEKIEWAKIFVKINRQSANRICSQMATAQGKVLRCNLNYMAGFRLLPRENKLEIEAESPDGRRYFAEFVIVTDAAAAQKQVGTIVPTKTLGFSGRKFAVVMGVSKYRYNDVGLGNLTYADADADSMYKWLTEKGGFSPNDILLLTNERATLGSVRDSLGRFLTKAAETDLILFFFAGHGTPDPFSPTDLYYLLHDSKVADLKNTGLPMIELKQIIDEKLKSKRAIFLLDTCHSAGVSGVNVSGPKTGKSGNGSRDLSETGYDERQLVRVYSTNTVSQAASKLFGSPGRAVFTSSDVNESSREGPVWGGGHGIFTWALLEGLNGKADTDGNRVITAGELFDFVSVRVRTETNSKQNPRLFSNLATGIEIAVLK